MSPVTLAELLNQSASGQGSIHYIQADGNTKTITYAQLKTRALRLLGYFQSQGVNTGDQMVLLMKENERFLDAFWACILGGITPVPLATGHNPNHKTKILQVFQQLSAPYLYTTKHDLNALVSFAESQTDNVTAGQLKTRSLLTELVSSEQELGLETVSSPKDLAFIQFSSGSTNTPKGVMLTHENLWANIQAMIKGAQLSGNDSTLGWMPLTHDMGLIGFHLVPMARGIKQYLLPTELFIRRPGSWINSIDQYRVTVTCSPNFGLKHFLSYTSPDQSTNWSLDCVRLILNGAEPISASLCREFIDYLKTYGLQEEVMFPVYGLAEASLAVTFPKPGNHLKVVSVDRHSLNVGQSVKYTNSENAVELVALGAPVEYCELHITDENDQPAPDGSVGNIIISGLNVTKGYYNNPQVTAESLTDLGLNTGDLGFIHEGDLVVCGRSKEIIFVNGQNYFPHDLETALAELPELELGRVVTTAVRNNQQQEELVVFVLHKGTLDSFSPLIASIKQHLTAKTGLEASHVLPVKQIPKTTSGKLQRFQLAKAFESGDFAETIKELESLNNPVKEGVAQNNNSTERILLSICQEFLPDKTLSVDDNLFELGTSSLVLTQIHDKIDELWPDRLELTDYFDYPTVRALAEHLDQP